VISDVMMPLIGGVQLCAILKANPATANIPVILMSAAGWTSAETLVMLGVAVAILAVFVLIELRNKAPLVPFPGIFRIRTIRGINITGLLIAMALFSMFFFISLYMQQVLGYDALQAGVAYLPLAVGIIISAGLASNLTTKLGVKPVLVLGLLLTAVGLFWFAQISPDGTYVGDILFPALVSAFGLGFAFVPMTIAAVAGVEPHEAGLASGMINTSQQVGGALGLAILAAVANSRTDSVVEAGSSLPVALTEGFQTALMVGSAFAVLGAVLALLLVDGREVEENVDGDLVPVTT